MMKATDKLHYRNDHNVNGSFIFPIRGFFVFLLFSLGFVSIWVIFPLQSPPPSTSIPKHDLIPTRTNAVIAKSQLDKCDLFKGHWVPDLNVSLYTNSACVTIPDSNNCFKNGRKDTDFLNWRWKPEHCELPMFDPFIFLKLVNGKKMAFLGDSVARNHIESLLCLLSQRETPEDVYKDSKNRLRTWHFPASNFTLMILWSKFLVGHKERVINGSNSGIYNIHVDRIDEGWAMKVHGLDYLIISSGHWFFRQNYIYKQNKIVGCIYCNEPSIKSLTVTDTLRMSFRAALSYIDGCKGCGDVLTILRTFSPAHFENGAWNDGGSCNRTRPFSKEEVDGYGKFELELRSAQIEEVERVRGNGGKMKRFTSLDVTGVMLERPDGHPGNHWGNQWMKGYNDCLHWCIPGPVDVWSALLMAVLQREGGFVEIHCLISLKQAESSMLKFSSLGFSSSDASHTGWVVWLNSSSLSAYLAAFLGRVDCRFSEKIEDYIMQPKHIHIMTIENENKKENCVMEGDGKFSLRVLLFLGSSGMEVRFSSSSKRAASASFVGFFLLFLLPPTLDRCILPDLPRIVGSGDSIHFRNLERPSSSGNAFTTSIAFTMPIPLHQTSSQVFSTEHGIGI
ncbi:hypothetical protein V2J09_001296 [Rumex salicifolius]